MLYLELTHVSANQPCCTRISEVQFGLSQSMKGRGHELMLAELSRAAHFYSPAVPLTIIRYLVYQVAWMLILLKKSLATNILLVSGVNSRKKFLLTYLTLLSHLLRSMVISVMRYLLFHIYVQLSLANGSYGVQVNQSSLHAQDFSLTMMDVRLFWPQPAWLGIPMAQMRLWAA